MPTFTQTKHAVADYAVARHIPLGCNAIHKLAERAYRLSAARPDLDDEVVLGRVFGLPDPTPRAAFRDIRDTDRAAARRLGLIGAGA